MHGSARRHKSRANAFVEANCKAGKLRVLVGGLARPQDDTAERYVDGWMTVQAGGTGCLYRSLCFAQQGNGMRGGPSGARCAD